MLKKTQTRCILTLHLVCVVLLIFPDFVFFLLSKIFKKLKTCLFFAAALALFLSIFFKHCHELLWKDDILNINGFGKQWGYLIFCVTGNAATHTRH